MVLFKNLTNVSQIMALSQENAIFPGSLCPSYGQTSQLHGDRYETKHADILRLRTFIFPGEEQKAYVES
jgi:hypothetical protein